MEQVNAAFLDLLQSNTRLRGYLASAVNLEQNQDEALNALGILEKTEKAFNNVYEANEEISSAMEERNFEIEALLDKLKNAEAIARKAFGDQEVRQGNDVDNVVEPRCSLLRDRIGASFEALRLFETGEMTRAKNPFKFSEEAKETNVELVPK